jgi:hypothetical protein
MADERKYYVLCTNNCKFEGMTKEQILTAITQAVETGEIKDVDTGFITSIKEQNSGAALSFWVGTQAQYNALTEIAQDCFYIITDDTSISDINEILEQHTKTLEDLSVDYAVEQGKSGIWTYEKRNSGVAECWGNIECSGDVFNAFTAVKIICDAIFPITFKGDINVTYGQGKLSGFHHIVSHVSFSNEKISSFDIICFTNPTESKVGGILGVNVKGRWK